MAAHEQTLARALQHQQAGEDPQAEALCLAIVRDGAGSRRGLEPARRARLPGREIARPPSTISSVPLAAAPADPTYRSNRGAVLQAQGRFAEAEADYRETLRLDPAHADALNNLCVLLRARLPAPEVEADCRAAPWQLAPGAATAHYNLGLALFDQGKLADATGCFRHALRLQPDYPKACNSLGHVLAQQGRHAEAEAQFRARGPPGAGQRGLPPQSVSGAAGAGAARRGRGGRPRGRAPGARCAGDADQSRQHPGRAGQG